MSSFELYRTATVEADGRTLHGIAVPFGRAARVSDDGGRTTYREAFNRASFTKSLKERGGKPFALGLMHPWAPGARTSPVPLGPVQFRAAADALEFEARLSNTRDADEALELLNDKVLGDVSIGFRSFRDRQAKDADGPYLERMEATPLELSLAIVGTGQHAGAEVLAIRSGSTSVGTPALDELRRRKALLIHIVR